MMNKWKYGVLDDAVDKASSNISLNKIQDDNGVYPVFGAKGIMKNISYFQQDKEYLSIIKDGAGIGRVSKHPAKSSILATMQYIIPKKEFNIDFVRYFLESLDFEEYRTGSTIPHIYYKDYKKVKFPLVDSNEQQQIVKILDQAFEAIDQAKANIEKNIANAKELFNSKKEDIFEKLSLEYTPKPIETACDNIFAGGDAPKDNFSKVKTKEFSIPIIANAVKDNGLYGYTNEAKVLKPSITIAARGSGTGHTEYRDYAYVPIVRLIVLIPNTDVIHVEFLMHAIKTLTILRSGSAIPQLTVPMIKGYSIPIPKFDKQIEIVKLLNELELNLTEYKSNLNIKLKDLEDLKKSILQKAFAGELTNKEVAV